MSDKYDKAVRKRARRYLRLTIGGDTWDEREEEDNDSDADAMIFKQYQESTKKKKEGEERKAWSSNMTIPKTTPEEEHRKKIQIQKWKDISFAVAAKMTKKERHRNPLDEMFFMVEEEDEEEEKKKKGIEGSVFHRSVTFDPVADTNEGDKRLVDLPPSAVVGVKRHKKSVYDGGAPLDQGGAKRALAKREVSHLTIGLTCSRHTDKNIYVEIKPLCARHFVCRQVRPSEERRTAGAK